MEIVGGEYLFVVMNDGEESSPSVLASGSETISFLSPWRNEIATASATQKPHNDREAGKERLPHPLLPGSHLWV